jgi:hypothetical protein
MAPDALARKFHEAKRGSASLLSIIVLVLELELVLDL